jgi:hypothetical protein
MTWQDFTGVSKVLSFVQAKVCVKGNLDLQIK